MFTIKIIKDETGRTQLLSSERIEYWKEVPIVKITKNTGEYKIVGERLRILLYGKEESLIGSYEISNSTVYIMQNGKTVEKLKIKEVEKLITEEVNT